MENENRLALLVGGGEDWMNLEAALAAAGVRVARSPAMADEALTIAGSVPAPGAMVVVAEADPMGLAYELVPALTRHLARVLAPGVRVNAVLAGGNVAAVIEAVVFLLRGTTFITGSVVAVDAGWHL